MTSSDRPVLCIEDLTVEYRQARDWHAAVRDVSLQIEPGQSFGLVGESGSGKSTLAMAAMRYLPPEGRIRSGRIEFAGQGLLQMDEGRLRAVWGTELNLVPQEPLAALNPSMRVGQQIAETLQHNLGQARAQAAEQTLQLLQMVRLSDAERVARAYPHQLSGGMQQRVLIAMALSTNPRLLVLDEPTTGLDVTTEAAILDLFRDLMRERDTASLYVTHNLGVVARLCDRMGVLYAGELVESGPVSQLFRQPLHPYTRGLIESIPRLGARKGQTTLSGLPGAVPPLGQRPAGCVYADRCPLAIERCYHERPAAEAPEAGRSVRCHRWREIQAGAVSAQQPVRAPGGMAVTGERVLAIDALAVHFPLPRSVAAVLARQPRPVVQAVDGVNLAIDRGETLGLVGESGSGKTTLARAVMGLVQPTAGQVELLGVSLPKTAEARSRALLRQLQFVAQNPQDALNPYLTVGEILSRPFITLLRQRPDKAAANAARLLEAVRLPASYLGRLPGQLSGGEKQRVAIARAFAANPDLLVADEPVSALDVSVQASILNLLNALQVEHGTAVLFVSHDIAVVGYMADVVAVMYLGQLMEVTPADDLLRPPHHPYTEALLAAVPVPDPRAAPEALLLNGPVPSAVNPPSGCPFHTRCPRFLGPVCVNEPPPWRKLPSGKRYYCHIPPEELAALQRVERDN